MLLTFQHPEYRSLTNENMIVSDDIALIRLNERVERSSDQDWICLPPSMELNDKSVLKVVSYDRFTDDHSVQTQLDVEVLHSPNSVRQCQQQLTDLAIDAFCTMSTSSSAFLGVVKTKIGKYHVQRNIFDDLGRLGSWFNAFPKSRTMASRWYYVETRPLSEKLLSHDQCLDASSMAEKSCRKINLFYSVKYPVFARIFLIIFFTCCLLLKFDERQRK